MGAHSSFWFSQYFPLGLPFFDVGRAYPVNHSLPAPDLSAAQAAEDAALKFPLLIFFPPTLCAPTRGSNQIQQGRAPDAAGPPCSPQHALHRQEDHAAEPALHARGRHRGQGGQPAPRRLSLGCFWGFPLPPKTPCQWDGVSRAEVANADTQWLWLSWEPQSHFRAA